MYGTPLAALLFACLNLRCDVNAVAILLVLVPIGIIGAYYHNRVLIVLYIAVAVCQLQRGHGCGGSSC